MRKSEARRRESPRKTKDAAARPRGSREPSAFPIVGVGASAGGLEAFTELLTHLPLDTGMGFVLVQHLDPQHESALTQLLMRATRLPVTEVTHNQRVSANQVHVIPRNVQLSIERGVLKLLPRLGSKAPHRPIDAFFESLAHDQGERAIGVVLSGTGADGTLGLEAIKAEGGITFAQDDTARYDSMPRSAVAAGCVDFILPPGDIAAELARVAKHSHVAAPPAAAHEDDAGPLPSGGTGSRAGPGSARVESRRPHAAKGAEGGFRRALLLLRNHSGVDFSLYKSTTIRRRITRRMVLSKHVTLSKYAEFLRGNVRELDALYSDVLISVTSFFRNPEAFDVLKKKVFPKLLSRPGDVPIRVWVLGCSTGQEAYSLAMAYVEVSERAPHARGLQVFATDLNDALLDKARNGLYPRNLAQDISPERLRRFFVEEEGGYRVIKALRDMVVFARQNLISDPPFSRIDLISCRNLLIYLEPSIQKKIFPTFHYALRPDGFLFLGASESIGGLTDLFETADKKHKIFSKKAAPAAALQLPARRARADVSPPARRPPLMVAAGAVNPEGVRGELSAQREADRVTINQCAPPGVLINADLQVLQFRGVTGAYLTPPTGKATFNVLKLAREGLMLPLRAAIHRAMKGNRIARKEGVQVALHGGRRTIDLEVIPLRNLKERCFLVLFKDQGKTVGDARVREAGKVRGRSPRATTVGRREESRRISDLEASLTESREYVQSVQEQHEAANEELQASNEEVQSANEELQSINEELETSKEELESANEELTTVNEEMASRNAELTRLNSDLVNLQSSTRLAIVLLARDLTIRRFSAQAEKQFNLMATDIGRPIGSIRHHLVIQEAEGDSIAALTDEDARERARQSRRPGRSESAERGALDELVAEVIDTVRETEREVRDRGGRWFSLRVRPYLTVDNKVDGAVLVLVDIDDLKRLEQVTAKARDYAESIVRAARNPMVVLSADLRIEVANEAFHRAFRVSPRDSKGKSIFELGRRPLNIPELSELLGDVLRNNRGFDDLEITHEFEAIGRRTVLASARPLSDIDRSPERILLAIQDVTEMLQYQAVVRESQARYRALVEASSQIVWTSDATGTMVEDSPSWREFTGQTFEQWRGSGWLDAIHPDDRNRALELWRRAVAEHTPVGAEYRIRRADGEWRWMAVKALPVLDTDGSVHGWVGMDTDVTESRTARESLAERAEELTEVDAARGRFLAVLAHELRSPLNAIRSWAYIMNRPGASEEERRKAVDVIERNSRLQSQLLDELLDAHRIGAGKVTLDLRRIDLLESVAAAVAAIEPVAQEKGVDLERDLDVTPAPILADPGRMQQVLGNLLANAVKYTPRGGRIQVILRTSGSGAQAIVTDSGEGIHAEALPFIFEPFRQADSSANRSRGGLGLGLSVVKQLLGLHGGSVEARSAGKGKGATFIVTIPLISAESQPRLALTEGSSDGADAKERLSGVMVLVVDDEPDSREPVRRLLEQAGAEVIAVSSVAEAIAAVREQRPDVLVSDLAMPGRDGFDLLRTIRSLPRGRGGRTPAIALTCLGAQKERDLALSVGFARHLVKPVEPPELVSAVAELAHAERADARS